MPADAQPGECAFIYDIDDQVKKVRTQFPVKKAGETHCIVSFMKYKNSHRLTENIQNNRWGR